MSGPPTPPYQPTGRPPAQPPAEWASHEAVWLAWPSQPDLWGSSFDAVREEFIGLCRAIADPGPDGRLRGERLRVLVLDEAGAREARDALRGLDPALVVAPFGDIWLRDTGPIFARGSAGLAALCFRFNGWGEKYRFAGDDTVARSIANATGAPRLEHPFVLEGGAVEFDGQGTLLTTRSCLLNPNRNPDLPAAEVEARLQAAFGVERVVWLESGLHNDHTDGHIDTLARFVAPGRVVCMAPSGSDDPNRETLLRVRAELESAVDARGRRLEVTTIPSPGLVEHEGEVMPASYVNFYIANSTVVVPMYSTPHDAPAVEALDRVFEDRRVVGSPARRLLEGGGAFHCITQQQPRGDTDAS